MQQVHTHVEKREREACAQVASISPRPRQKEPHSQRRKGPPQARGCRGSAPVSHLTRASQNTESTVKGRSTQQGFLALTHDIRKLPRHYLHTPTLRHQCQPTSRSDVLGAFSRPGKKMKRGRPPTKAPRYAWSPAFTSRVSSVVSAGFCSAKGEVACYDHSGSIVTCLAAQRRLLRRHHQPFITPPALPSPRHHPDVNQNVCRDRGAQVLALTRV